MDLGSGLLAEKGIHVRGVGGMISDLDGKVRAAYQGTDLAHRFEQAQTGVESVDAELSRMAESSTAGE